MMHVAHAPLRRQPQHHNHRPPASTHVIGSSALMKDLTLGE
jgi:hypothetical protein